MDLLRIAARVASVRLADAETAVTTVEIWRGMTGLKPAELQQLIGETPGEEGAVEVDIDVPQSEMGWWSVRKNMALIYSCTDPVSGPKGPGQARYDVVLHGEAVVSAEDAGKLDVTHQLRAKDTKVRVTEIYYAKRQGDSKSRRARLESVISGGTAPVSRAASVRVASDVWARISAAYAPTD